MNKLALAIILLSAPSLASELPHERTGSSRMKHKSLPNTLVAAHFQCNREGLWANLDTMEVVDTSTSRYAIAGGTKKITEYRTTVKFECSADYQKDLPEKEE